MKKTFLFCLCLVLLISNYLSAQCSDGQVNINTASATELDQLTGVGLTIAQNIISSRPFNSVDDLINVNRIGNITLGKIKTQGLACVESQSSSIENKKTEVVVINNSNTEKTNIGETVQPAYEEPIKKEIKTIDLTGNSVDKNNSQKDIKISDVKLNLNKYALYGLAVFCIIIGFLFLRKNNKEKKNEFK